MDPAAGGLLQVLGEDEALRQFFNGQDVHGVLESSVAVDTSILERYLSNDMETSSFMLPDSPPDSASEPCSPPQIPDLRYEPSHWSDQDRLDQDPDPVQQGQVPVQPMGGCPGSWSCSAPQRGSVPQQPEPLTHAQLHSVGLTRTLPLDSEDNAHTHLLHRPPPLLASPHPLDAAPLLNSHGHAHTSLPHQPAPFFASPLHAAPPSASECPAPTPPACIASQHGGKRRRSAEGEEGLLHLLSWNQFKEEQWSQIYSISNHTLPALAFHVETDKGFLFSTADEAFVCQKKNHFQVTVHVGVVGEPGHVATPTGPMLIDHFLIHVFGVKMEASNQQVTIEQSQANRSKMPFHPIRVSLPSNKVTKVTLCRLHFSETTANNMRKKGRPNPEQRYFQMVVAVYAAVGTQSFMLTALASEKIIVRASNPGQFEAEAAPLWQRGVLQDQVVVQARVGINTEAPDEALVVCGNAKVMGVVMHPSDRRAKDNIQEVDSEQQLRRISQMRIVRYDFKPEFATTMGIDPAPQTGIIAQEVLELLPAAVKEVGDVTCSDGEKINNFLMVDKEQIFMENVGAVKQLCKLTDNLETRIQGLEVWNSRLGRLKSLSKGKPTPPSVKAPPLQLPGRRNKGCWGSRPVQVLQHKVFQASVFTLLATMALCVISITALYLLTLRQEDGGFDTGSSDSNVFPLLTTTPPPTTGPPPTEPGPLPPPPDVDFCELLYCEEVYCCPSSPGASTEPNSNATTHAPGGGPQGPILSDQNRARLFDELRNAKDWTNTTIQMFVIKENQQKIDGRYLDRQNSGSGRLSFVIPIGRHVPVNMRITLIMNSTELLVIHLCSLDESSSCSALLDLETVTGTRYPSNTQGEHEWSLHVARLQQSSYHFRSTVAGQADCSTDRHYAGALFTDYTFTFYRHCME